MFLCCILIFSRLNALNEFVPRAAGELYIMPCDAIKRISYLNLQMLYNVVRLSSKLLVADHEAADYFVYRRIIVVFADSEVWSALCADWLRSIFY